MAELSKEKSRNIELLATVCKVIQDIKSTHPENIFDELNKSRWMNNEDIARQSQLMKIVAQLDREFTGTDKASSRSR